MMNFMLKLIEFLLTNDSSSSIIIRSQTCNESAVVDRHMLLLQHTSNLNLSEMSRVQIKPCCSIHWPSVFVFFD